MLVNSFNKVYLKKKLNPEMLNQIKDFDHEKLVPNQEKLLAELIPSEE